jgi:hypothetical protein
MLNKKMIGAGDGEWLVEFKGRNPSGAYNQNFLWKRGNVYVMDNHRAALWCWLQHIHPGSSHSIFHIDRHTDTLTSRLDEWLRHLPPSWKLTIKEYLEHSYHPCDFGNSRMSPVFRWDNYLSIYLASFGNFVDCCCFAIHDGDDDKPNHQRVEWVGLWDIPSNLDYQLAQRKPWIMNIDLDYFFWHDDAGPGLMVSDAYIDHCVDIVRQRIDDGTIAVTTICLTPEEEFTGGWEPSERLLEHILSRLGIDFKLP